MLTFYHLRYVDKWYADILQKLWYVDIHHGMMVCSHLIIQGILIKGMLTLTSIMV